MVHINWGWWNSRGAVVTYRPASSSVFFFTLLKLSILSMQIFNLYYMWREKQDREIMYKLELNKLFDYLSILGVHWRRRMVIGLWWDDPQRKICGIQPAWLTMELKKSLSRLGLMGQPITGLTLFLLAMAVSALWFGAASFLRLSISMVLSWVPKLGIHFHF